MMKRISEQNSAKKKEKGVGIYSGLGDLGVFSLQCWNSAEQGSRRHLQQLSSLGDLGGWGCSMGKRPIRQHCWREEHHLQHGWPGVGFLVKELGKHNIDTVVIKY